MPLSPPRTMKLTGSRGVCFCSNTPIPIVGRGLCHAATVVMSSPRLPLKPEQMIGTLLNLLSFVNVSPSAGRSTAISMLARMLIPLMSCILKARIVIPLGTCMRIVRASLVLLEIAPTTTKFRICAFPARRPTDNLK